jgi:hypothetical protein
LAIGRSDIAQVVRAIADGHLDYCTGQVIMPMAGSICGRCKRICAETQ